MTKPQDGGEEAAKVQLAVWAAAWFTRIRELGADEEEMPVLPVLYVQGAEWWLLWARSVEGCVVRMPLTACADCKVPLTDYLPLDADTVREDVPRRHDVGARVL